MLDTELYKLMRPTKLSQMVGQPEAVKVLSSFAASIPHTVLFVGPSGCGKTTLARIAAGLTGAHAEEVKEINCADNRGIELARELRRSCVNHPLQGKSKVYILDECAHLTRDAMTALLKLLEDTPKHVYFFLCTTDPNKLLPTIISRCTEIKLKKVDGVDIRLLLDRAVKKYGLEVGDDTYAAIVNESEGSPRKALVMLNQVMNIENPEEQADAVAKASFKAEGFAVAKALMNPRCSWSEVAALLKAVADEPEAVRYMVMGYARSVLLGGGTMAPRAALIIDRFAANFFDSKAAGLALACYEVVVLSGKK